MYPDKFDYYTADTVEETVELLHEHEDSDVELLAGGHSLIPTMKSGLASPDVIIDINGIENIVGIDADDEGITLGALTRYATVTESDTVANNAELIAEAAGVIADVQVRNRGTVGGNVAHADPASDLPGATLAADATIIVEGPNGERTIGIDDFFKGTYQTALKPEELLVRINIPTQGDNAGSAYVKKPHPGSGYATVGVGVTLEIEDETITSARVAANGVVDRAVRLETVEDALEDVGLNKDTFADAADRAGDTIDDVHIMEDTYASPTVRRRFLKEYTERALREAANRVT